MNIPTAPKTCDNCIWLRRFEKRPDEECDLGCEKPGWEGYTTLNKPACGGTLFIPKGHDA